MYELKTHAAFDDDQNVPYNRYIRTKRKLDVL